MSTFARLTLLLAALFPTAAISGEFRVHPEGFGPIRIGMSVKQASGLLGTPLIKLIGTYQDDRYVVYPKKGFSGLSFGVSSEGNISNVYIGYTARRFRTDRGLRIGSTEQDLQRLYGNQIEVKTYQCYDLFHIYLYHQPGNLDYGIKYTVNGEGKVEGIMSGSLNAVVPQC